MSGAVLRAALRLGHVEPWERARVRVARDLAVRGQHAVSRVAGAVWCEHVHYEGGGHEHTGAQHAQGRCLSSTLCHTTTIVIHFHSVYY